MLLHLKKVTSQKSLVDVTLLQTSEPPTRKAQTTSHRPIFLCVGGVTAAKASICPQISIQALSFLTNSLSLLGLNPSNCPSMLLCLPPALLFSQNLALNLLV